MKFMLKFYVCNKIVHGRRSALGHSNFTSAGVGPFCLFFFLSFDEPCWFGATYFSPVTCSYSSLMAFS